MIHLQNRQVRTRAGDLADPIADHNPVASGLIGLDVIQTECGKVCARNRSAIEQPLIVERDAAVGADRKADGVAIGCSLARGVMDDRWGKSVYRQRCNGTGDGPVGVEYADRIITGICGLRVRNDQVGSAETVRSIVTGSVEGSSV